MGKEYNRYEEKILERRKHFTCYLPSFIGLVVAALIVLPKIREPRILPDVLGINFIKPATLKQYETIYFAEWGAAAILALISLSAMTRLAKERFIITDRRLVHLKNRKRGEFLELGDIFTAKVEKGSACLWTHGLVDCGNIRLTSTLGEHLMKGVTAPEEFINILARTRDDDLNAGGRKPAETADSHETRVPVQEAPVKEKDGFDGIPSFMRPDWEGARPQAEEDKKEGREKDDEDRVTNPLQVLDSLIGLVGVKNEVRSLANFITVQKKRAEMGLPQAEIALHTIFKGNPGTGKTTVARIMASIYYETGVLPKGHVVETDRGGLVAEYVGQTAVKTGAVIDKALGGVLFVDEAYSLTEGGDTDYGREAVTTLLKRMEDDRGKFAVILAGYPGNMEGFLESNPGLRSRFSRTISFPDYTESELTEIFHLQARKNGYILSEEGEKKLAERIRKDVSTKDRNFGNARYVRNLFEKSIQNQADRLVRTQGDEGRNLSVLEAEDIHF